MTKTLLVAATALAALLFSTPARAAGLEPFAVREGIPNAAAKLKKGGDFTIVFLGGSITKGGGDHGFTQAVPAWLRTITPQAKIKVINAGINGTDSDFGAARADRDVIALKPDLVFVEFAVNDGTNDRARSMERIVRKIWMANPATDIVFLYTISQDQLETYQKGELPKSAASHEKVANFYGIPSITLATGLLEKLKAGTAWSALMRDGAHPNETGYGIYLEEIKQALTAASRAGKLGRTLKTETLTPNLKVYPDAVAAKPMPKPKPLTTADGKTAKVTWELPTAGEYWRDEHEYKVEGKNLWAVQTQPWKKGETRLGGKLDATFGLSRAAWQPMRWLAESGAFDGPEGMPLWKGNLLAPKENDLPVIVFIAPETGRYAFEAKSGGVSFNSQHRNVALNVVHFPWGKEEGKSIAFFKTDKTEKKPLDLTFEQDLQAGEMVAFALDTNVNGGGGTAAFKEFTIRAGLLP